MAHSRALEGYCDRLSSSASWVCQSSSFLQYPQDREENAR